MAMYGLVNTMFISLNNMQPIQNVTIDGDQLENFELQIHAAFVIEDGMKPTFQYYINNQLEIEQVYDLRDSYKIGLHKRGFMVHITSAFKVLEKNSEKTFKINLIDSETHDIVDTKQTMFFTS